MDPELQTTLSAAQRGLLMRPLFGHVLTVRLRNKDSKTRDLMMQVVRHLEKTITTHPNETCASVIGFAPALWEQWTGRSIPISAKVLGRGHNLRDTGGDVLIYIKALDAETAAQLVAAVLPALEPLVTEIENLTLGKRQDGRVLGGRYVDHITNPNDPISLAEDVLVPDEGPSRGATFGLTQKFILDWDNIAAQTGHGLDAIIGRRPNGEMMSQHEANAHVHRAHILDKDGSQRKLLRQALPFSHTDGLASREKGMMFVAFCNEQQRFEDILHSMIGGRPSRPADRLLHVVQGVAGAYWYVPAAAELGTAGVQPGDDVVLDAHWDVRSPNGYLFYNSRDYMHHMAGGHYIGGDAPSARILSLLSRAFSHWIDGWMVDAHFPRLPHLKDQQLPGGMPESVAERKGLADYMTLSHLLSSPHSEVARKAGLLRIAAKELIVGAIPDFTLGRGKEVVPYLDEDETLAAWLRGSIDEWSAMGHVVPDFQTLVDRGLGAMIEHLHQHEQGAAALGSRARRSFYVSARHSLRGVQEYLWNWAKIANHAHDSATWQEDKDSMRDVAGRLQRLGTEAPASFHDAVQLIFSFHCCLHLVGELTAFHRLDQTLWPFLERDLQEKAITMERAQEIVDALWIKIGEPAFVNRAFIHDYRTYGTTTINARGGNFPQGGGLNQWVQQVTVGGYKATDSEAPEGGANPVTLLCLKAARRLPVNAPSLSLRVYRDMPAEYLHEAARSLLAGGAHPTLYQDDRMCEGLWRSGECVTRARARDYAADGCFEPLFSGASEFTFGSVPLLLALEQTLNQGATYGAAGSVYLRGLKQTFRSPDVADIATFAQLQDVFLDQVRWLAVQAYHTILTAYGNLADVCPSPLLSSVLEGCVESGRDLTAGGARFHIIAPLCIGVANTINSLYAIKKLCFDPPTARCTLTELLKCLICDWGFDMMEPYQDVSLGPASAAASAVRFQELREEALKLPKWATGRKQPDDETKELRGLGQWLLDGVARISVETLREPPPALGRVLEGIDARYGPGFEFVVTPGVGTFEGYVGDGLACGASADGRRRGAPIASDMSASPSPQDRAAAEPSGDVYEALRDCALDSVEHGLSNAAPVDLNIPEAFPLDRLQAFVAAFARGDVGGNYLTLTCADPDTYRRASADAERYNLLRVRMGGWSEFYPTMFPDYQEHAQRRQYYEVRDS